MKINKAIAVATLSTVLAIFLILNLVVWRDYNGNIIIGEDVYSLGEPIPESYYENYSETYSCSNSNTMGDLQVVTCRCLADPDSFSIIFYEDNWNLVGISILLDEEELKAKKMKLSVAEGEEIKLSELDYGVFYENGFLYSKVLHENKIYLNLFKLNRKLRKLRLPPSWKVEFYY
ncbi:MAG: hypothetical protein AAFY76_02815 [Cyanobacteria bacterium J06649_11]